MEGIADWIGQHLQNAPWPIVLLAVLIISAVWIGAAFYWNVWWITPRRVDLGGKKNVKK